MENLQEYVSCIKDFMVKFKNDSDAFCALYRIYEENKTSLDVLMRNMGADDGDAAKASEVFLKKLNEQDAQLRIKTDEVAVAKAQLLSYKVECVNVLKELMDLAQDISIAISTADSGSGSGSDIDKYGVQDTDAQIMTKCAKLIHGRVNAWSDMRASPPIHGVYREDEQGKGVTIKSAEPEYVALFAASSNLSFPQTPSSKNNA